MEHASAFERSLRALALVLIVLFFLFPIFWILLMSFQPNRRFCAFHRAFFAPTSNYQA